MNTANLQKINAKNSGQPVVIVDGKVFPIGYSTHTCTAAAGDIRQGKTAVTSSGKVVGNLVVPNAAMVKITAFTPGNAAYTEVLSIAVSGFGDVVDGYGDTRSFNNWNGTYEATPETAEEKMLSDRIFKHTQYEKYIFLFFDSDSDRNYWVLAEYPEVSYLDEAEFYSGYDSGSDTSFPCSMYNSRYDFSVQVQIDMSTVLHGANSDTIKGKAADFVKGKWEIYNEVSVLNITEEPVPDGIYLRSGDNLLGGAAAFDFDKWMPQYGLLCYFPMNEKGNTAVDRVNGIRCSKIGKLKSDGYAVDNSRQKGAVVGTQNVFTLPDVLTLSAKVKCTGKSSNDTNVVEFGTRNVGGFGIRASCRSTTVDYGLRIGSDDTPRQISGISHNEEHTVTFTFDKGKTCRSYLDGVLTDEMSFDPGTVDDAAAVEMFCRYIEGEDNGGFWHNFPGTIRDVLLYNRVLSDTEIAEIAAHR